MLNKSFFKTDGNNSVHVQSLEDLLDVKSVCSQEQNRQKPFELSKSKSIEQQLCTTIAIPLEKTNIN